MPTITKNAITASDLKAIERAVKKELKAAEEEESKAHQLYCQALKSGYPHLKNWRRDEHHTESIKAAVLQGKLSAIQHLLSKLA
jgi:hypothetical protein